MNIRPPYARLMQQMPLWGNNSLSRAMRPFGCAMLFMTAGDDRLGDEPAEEFRPVWAALLGQSIAFGAAMTALWNVAGAIFGGGGIEYSPWYASTVAVLALMFLGPCQRSLLQAGRLLGRQDPAAAAAAGCLLLLMFALLLLALRPIYLWPDPFHQKELVIPAALAWMRPEFDGTRVIVLMPIWGCWGMLILTQIKRPCGKTEPALAAMAKGCGPIAASMSVLLPLLGTWFYFQFLGSWQHLAISAFAAGGAILGGLGFVRLAGGLTRQAVLATNLVVQLAFMLGYLFAHVPR